MSMFLKCFTIVFGNTGDRFSYPLAYLYFMVLDTDSSSRGVSRGH